MPELTLTRRWIIHKTLTETRRIKSGVEVEYYGNTVSKPSMGKIRKKKGVFVIEWEDCSEDTKLDGSDHSIKVLKDCGFAD